MAVPAKLLFDAPRLNLLVVVVAYSFISARFAAVMAVPVAF